MAPSRALLRLVHIRGSIIAQSRPFCHRNAHQWTLEGLQHHGRLAAPSFRLSTKRAYAAEAASSAAPEEVEAPDYLSESEREIFDQLKEELEPTKLEVQDISGGCGSMYAIEVASKKFQGMTTIKQHRLINSILSEKIKQWHGVQLRTRVE